jgi:hypothetical protein
MTAYPSDEFAKRIGGFDLELQRFGVLRLTAGPFQKNNELACNGESDTRPEIFLD